MRYLFLVWLISGLTSACVPKQPVGSYSRNYVISYTRLDIDSNNRFVYQCREDMSGMYSQGRWAVRDKVLYLNSDSIVTKINGITKEKKLDKEGFSISFFDLNFKTPYPEIEFVINDSITGSADTLGNFFYNGFISSVYIVFGNRHHYYYRVNDIKSNHLDICLFGYVNDEIFFLKKKFILSGNRLIGEDGRVFRKKKGLSKISQRYKAE